MPQAQESQLQAAVAASTGASPVVAALLAARVPARKTARPGKVARGARCGKVAKDAENRKVESASPPFEPAAPAAAAAPLEPKAGDAVIVTDHSTKSLNGQRGVVHKADSAKTGCWLVHVQSGENRLYLSIPHINLKLE